MRREDMTEDEWIDYGDDLYHRTRENMLAPRSEWGPNEWRLAQIEGRLQPQACTCGTGPGLRLGPHAKWCALWRGP